MVVDSVGADVVAVVVDSVAADAVEDASLVLSVEDGMADEEAVLIVVDSDEAVTAGVVDEGGGMVTGWHG